MGAKDLQAPSAPASPLRPRAPFRQAGGFGPQGPPTGSAPETLIIPLMVEDDTGLGNDKLLDGDDVEAGITGVDGPMREGAGRNLERNRGAIFMTSIGVTP